MPIQDAINFIQAASGDKALRDSLATLKRDEIFPELENKGFKFNIPEFEESVNLMHVQCKTQEQADFLFEVVWWFKMVYQ